jgi:arylsulfatase A
MHSYLSSFAISSCFISLIASASVQATDRPNIILILADDLGYGDVKCLNPAGKISTPHLDNLAKQGMVFTDAHSGSSVCTPTRYGLMTGRYAWRSKLQSGVLGGLSPRLIESNRETLPSLLKANGYHTACIGKWHLGMDFVLKQGKSVNELSIESREQVFNVDYTSSIKNGPNSVGFQYFYGISASLDMVPYALIENDRLVSNPTEDRSFAMRADRIKGMTRKGPTEPNFYPQDVLPTCTQKAIDFINLRANDTNPFFLYLPLTSPHTPIAPSKEWKDRSKLGAYADFVMQTDHAVGEILRTLDKAKLTDKTLVIFTSDNGCSPEADFPELLKHEHNPSYHFRGHKADIYEGGHRVPFIVSWPGKVSKGSMSNQLVCLTDVLKTCVEVIGIGIQDTVGEDSFSFLPALHGKKSDDDRKTIVHHSINGSFAIRKDEWKLCLCPGSGGWSFPRPNRDSDSQLPAVQLFNLAEDISEKKNLTNSYPERVRDLTNLLQQLVAHGRSTPGKQMKNAVQVDIWKFPNAKAIPKQK